MRTARPVGLSQDGMSLIVAAESGEELAIPVDERLHAALRGDRPRLGQLEIEMENALGPRDIQSRIRAGQSLAEVGRVAGLPLDRVERFAAPVLAEREHVALLAMSSSVRRRGETSGHRLLRLAVTERLMKRGVDIETVDWDSFRLEDGRWSVSAEYQFGDASRRAMFLFDLQGRFSVAGNDEARWVLGEHSSAKGPQPGRRRPPSGDGEAEEDTEPTLDLNDELALVRVVQPPDATLDSGADPNGTEQTEPEGTRAGQAASPATGRQPSAAADHRDVADEDRVATVRDLFPIPDQVRAGDRFGEQPGYEEIPPSEGGYESPLETLASMLDASRNAPAPAAHGGLSDASAVPVTDNSGWEPGIVVNYPVEPSPERNDEGATPEASTDQATSESGSEDHPASAGEPASEADEAVRRHDKAARRGTDTPAAPEPPVEGEDRAEEAEALEDEQAANKAARRPAAKRKRAAVPSWDEIMFGGPTRSS
jgi:hypothetical protein